MEYLKFPKLLFPKGGYLPVGQPRPIEVCSTCHYVLANDRTCHNLSCVLAGSSSSNGESSGLKYYNNCSFCRKSCTGH